ncbi:MAG: hypothetical protein IPI88_06645 [Chitinophagaceae bacterium]|nr:hypothetical protein [Chitinophagaceae bacterium]
MFSTKRYIISLALIVLTINLPAQNLTGTWEGALSNDQFLQLNIIQTGDKICGYTFDHVKLDERSFCKAFLKAGLITRIRYFILMADIFKKFRKPYTDEPATGI